MNNGLMAARAAFRVFHAPGGGIRYRPAASLRPYGYFNRRLSSGGRRQIVGAFLQIGSHVAGRLIGRAIRDRAFRAKVFKYTPVGVLLFSSPLLLFGGWVFNQGRLENVPFSNRSHMVFLSEEEEEQLSMESAAEILRSEASRLLPQSHPVLKTATRIVEDLRMILIDRGCIPASHTYKLHIIESSVANAFVLPNGNVFLYTGILPYTRNEAGAFLIICSIILEK
jgi:hypothetical protein